MDIEESEEDYEHLQLSLEEAFFLVFAIECISITEAAVIHTTAPDTFQPGIETKQSVTFRRPSSMSIQECWLQFSEASVPRQQPFQTQHPLLSPSGFEITPSNPFVVRYVVYHYYRSQGWVVKDGLKYGTDFLLYKKGLVFGHSQYAVKVVPCESELDLGQKSVGGNASSKHPEYRLYSFLSPTPGLCQPHGALSWQWLLTLNRVIAQVQKVIHCMGMSGSFQSISVWRANWATDTARSLSQPVLC